MDGIRTMSQVFQRSSGPFVVSHDLWPIINISNLLAAQRQGSRVIPIEADLRNLSATRKLGRDAEAGILKLLQSNAAGSDVLMVNPKTQLASLRAVVKQRFLYSFDLMTSKAMDRMINHAAVTFDYIAFNVCHLALLVDARATSSKIDTPMFVIEWGNTSRQIVNKILVDIVAILQTWATLFSSRPGRKI